MTISCRLTGITLLGSILYAVPTVGQDRTDQALRVTRIEARPSSVVLTVGESTRLSVRALDVAGNEINAPMRVAAPFRVLRFRNGVLSASEAGEYEIVLTVVLPPDAAVAPVSVTIPVTVNWPAVERIAVASQPERLYQGTTLAHSAVAYHEDGTVRPDPQFTWSTSNSAVANVDQFGNVSAVGTGNVRVVVEFEGVRAELQHTVSAFPGAHLEIGGGATHVRTGDVQNFESLLTDARGQRLDDVPVSWSLAFVPDDESTAPSGPGQIIDGKVVTDVPGVYTVIASAGPLVARKSFRAEERDVIRSVQMVGHGRQDTHYTSDFWVFEGLDGRDYALTGSRQGQSHAFVWDVTDPSNIVKTDSFQVDARSVNDVKVSPDARYGVFTREGASNRRNGLVILDLANPAHPTIAATFDERLTGGVHNVFVTNDHVFAVSGGDKYVILDVADISNPRFVSEYDHPNSRIHDVWVHDGIAYSAEWQTGVVVVDVGNGKWGGTIEEPKLVTAFPLPSGATHAVFPYYQESSGRFYLFVGDEITNRRGLAWQGTGPDVRQPYDPETGRGGYPRATSGYIQIIDFTDPANPHMVARYEVTEYGTHNIWVEDDILYQAYYEGGVRMVDVSGELMGNLYTQDREIAVFKAHDPIGWIANAPAAWSVMPHKGHIFFSDISSGLWAVKLEPKEALTP